MHINITHTLSITDPSGDMVEGIVIKKSTGQYIVHSAERTFECPIAPEKKSSAVADKSRQKSRTPVSAELRRGREAKGFRGLSDTSATFDIAVGDQVVIQAISNDEGRIISRLPRRNVLERRAAGWTPGRHAESQVIAANIDRVVAVIAAAQPAPKWNLLDRYLVSAEAAGIPALVCLTKSDLSGDLAELEQVLEEYRRIGYPAIVSSAETGAGLEALRSAIAGGVSALVGKSGVGKTSLLNALQPGLGLRVKAVSQANEKGRHTTVHVEMFELEGGGALVDTPGTREFGLWDIGESDLAMYFPEMRPYLGRCKFGLGCRHHEEPGCAVRTAVKTGAVSPHRYKSFQRLLVDR